MLADQIASSSASAPARVNVPAGLAGIGRFGVVKIFAWRSPSAVSTPYSSSGALVPPVPRQRCTVPVLVSNLPLSTVVTGCGLRVSTGDPVAADVPAIGS